MIAWLLALSLLAHASDDTFQPPGKAFIKTKFAKDCGISESLKADMPPVEDQMKATWCTTFADKGALDYFLHRHHPGDHYENLISPMDLASWNTDLPDSQRGKRPPVGFTSARPFSIFEGAQASKQIYLDQDYPFDQSLFGEYGTLDMLGAYYDGEKPYADLGALRCVPPNLVTNSLESQFPGLSALIGPSGDFSEFLAKLQKKYPLAEGPAPGAKRKPIHPPFDIRQVFARSGDQIAEELRSKLREKDPVVVGVCQNQLIQQPHLGLGYPVEDKTSCRPHALLVTGMKNINGKCQVEVRNSWGTGWPAPKGDGYAYMPIETFLHVLYVNEDGASLTSISERKSGGPAQNQIVNNGQVYTGETARELPEGQGKLVAPNGDTFAGTFIQGTFRKGVFKGKLTDGSNYDGQMADGRLNGYGVLTRPDGTQLRGTFKNGRLVGP